MNRLLSVFLLPAALAAAAVVAPPRAQAADDYEAYFKENCVDCHQMKKNPLEDKHLSHQEWQDAIEKMIQLDKLDPVPSKALVAGLADWLAQHHGPAAGR